MKLAIPSFLFLSFLLFSGSLWSQGLTEETHDVTSPHLVKGNGFIGTNFLLRQKHQENVDELINNFIVESSSLRYVINLYGGYFVKDHLGVGLQTTFQKKSEDIDFLDGGTPVFEESVEQVTTIAGIVRHFLTFDKRGRWSIINQVNVGYGFGEELVNTNTDGEIVRRLTDISTYELSLNPGIVFVSDKGVSLESTLGLLGWQYERRHTPNPDGTVTLEKDHKVLFEFELIQLFLGLTFYIDGKKN